MEATTAAMAATTVATMAATMAVTTEATIGAMVPGAKFALRNATVTTMMRTAGMAVTTAGKRNLEADLTSALTAIMVITATNASTSATAITMMKTAGMVAMTAGRKPTAVMTAAGGKNQNVTSLASPHAMTIANGGMKNAGKSTIGVSESSELWLECHNS